jgi:hypothetical protein
MSIAATFQILLSPPAQKVERRFINAPLSFRFENYDYMRATRAFLYLLGFSRYVDERDFIFYDDKGREEQLNFILSACAAFFILNF